MAQRSSKMSVERPSGSGAQAVSGRSGDRCGGCNVQVPDFRTLYPTEDSVREFCVLHGLLARDVFCHVCGVLKMDLQHQRYSLKWNEFQLHVSRAFGSLREQEAFTDITLGCDGRVLKAHRVVLCASSPYFRQLLEGHDSSHPIVFLKDVSHLDMEAILDFIYTGAVDLDQAQLQSFLTTAEALQIKGLTKGDSFQDLHHKTSPFSHHRVDEVSTLGRENPLVKHGHPESSSSEEEEQTLSDTFTQYTDQNLNNISPLEELQNGCEDSKEKIHPVMQNFGADVDSFQSEFAVPLKKRAKTVSVPTVLDSTETQASEVKGLKGSYSEFVYSKRLIKGSRAGVSKYGLSPDLKCSQCDKVFVHAASLIKHRSFHEGNTVCPFCKRIYSHKYTLREHVIREHGDRVHEVPSIAFKKTPSRSTLKDQGAGAKDGLLVKTDLGLNGAVAMKSELEV